MSDLRRPDGGSGSADDTRRHLDVMNTNCRLGGRLRRVGGAVDKSEARLLLQMRRRDADMLGSTRLGDGEQFGVFGQKTRWRRRRQIELELTSVDTCRLVFLLDDRRWRWWGWRWGRWGSRSVDSRLWRRRSLKLRLRRRLCESWRQWQLRLGDRLQRLRGGRRDLHLWLRRLLDLLLRWVVDLEHSANPRF